MSFCLLLTGIVVHRQDGPASTSREESVSLAETFTDMKQWHNSGDIPLSSDVVETLKLDDYLFRNFSNGRQRVTLYIGYYYTRKKIGAAHDPVVCFPGQGWVLSGMDQGKLSVPAAAGDYQVHYSSMVAERDEQKIFLVYWFQADDKALADTFNQKLAMLRGTFLGGIGGNAFVRISVDLEQQTEKEALDTVVSFVEVFYPVFFEYVNGEGKL